MAKRGTLTHRRTRRLAALLRVPLPCALGVLEALWHVTAERATAGDIGRLTDQDIADEMWWESDAGELVRAMVEAGAVEEDPKHRLIVHGWSEHADDAVHLRLARAGRTFADGSTPRSSRLAKTERRAHDDSTPADAVRTACAQIPSPSAPPEPVPVPEPVPEPEERTPPTPRADAPGGAGRQLGDVLADGRTVLEVDAHGPVVVRRPAVALALLGDGSLRAAVARLAAYHKTQRGVVLDRGAQRALRTRLVGGETEAEIQARWDHDDAQRAVVTEAWPPERVAAERARILGARAAAVPPDDEPDDETQALRLVGHSDAALAAAGR